MRRLGESSGRHEDKTPGLGLLHIREIRREYVHNRTNDPQQQRAPPALRSLENDGAI